MTPHVLTLNEKPTRWSVLCADDDGQPCGGPFDPTTFGYILPQNAWSRVIAALEGTHFTVERLGMLWNRSFWFVSVSLDELKSLALPGHKFQLNFSGGLDGSKSPQCELSDIRAVCHNTISLSRATGEVLFKIRQTSKSQGRLDKATAEVEKACGMARVFAETMKSLEGKPLSTPDARALFAGEYVQKGGNFNRRVSDKTGKVCESRGLNQLDSLVTLFAKGDGNRGETVADAVNAMTQRLTRGDDDSKANVWTRVSSSEYGGNATRKAEFFNLCADDDKRGEAIETGRKALVEANA